MTRRYERRPGSDESLLALYDLVPAAEEFDLADQVRVESALAELRVFSDWPDDSVESVADDSDWVIPSDDEAHVSMHQAVGIIEHLLGGRSIHEGDRLAD